MKESTRHPAWQRYSVAVGAVAAMAALRWAVHPITGTYSPMSTFYLAVMAAAWWGGLGPGLLAVALSVLAANVFFLSVPGRLNMPQLHQWVLMVTFVSVNVLVCLMVEALHRARRASDARAREIREKHDALERAEAQLEYIVESVHDVAIIAMDIDGRILRWNTGASGIFGYPEEEVHGQPADLIFTQQDRAAGIPERELKEARENGWSEDERWHLRKDGTRFYGSGSVSPVRDGSGRLIGFTMVLRDATERWKTLRALRESEESFKAVFETVAAGTVLLDPRTSGFLRVNRYFCQITGYSEKELRGMTVRDLTYSEDREAHFEAFQRTARGDAESYATDKRYVRKDGRVIWVHANGILVHDVAGRPRYVVGVVLDITERKQEEERLHRREAAMLALATTRPASLEERIRQVTEAASGALGVERVSVWLYTANRLAIQCEDLYTRSQRKHERGNCLTGSSYPSYFTELARGAPIVAEDARTHEATAEFWQSYLEPLNISSMLDVPIWVSGRLAGMICHEHTGPARRWSVDDQEFAASLGTTVALALESEQRRRAEEALAEAEERLRLAAKAGGVGTFDVNFETGEYHWSPEMNTIFGVPSDAEVSFEQIPSLIYPEDRERVAEKTEQALAPGGPGHFESVHRLLRPDGSVRWVRVNGRTDFTGDGSNRRAARMLGTAQDITALKEAEEAAQEIGERFRTLADNITQLAWMTNERGWTFWDNQRWLDFAGMTPEELQGWRWQKFVHPAHVLRVVEKFRHHIERGKVWEDTYPLRGRDGSYRWFLSRAVPIRDAQGRVTRWFGSNTDVTEQRKTEEELREVDRHKSEFLAMLGHELRNPLAAIRNALALCHVENESFEWAKGVVERQSAQLARLVDDLMDVSRIARGKVTLRRERVEVCAAVWRAVEAARPLLVQRGHELSVECPPHELWVDADPARFGQIVGNLLTNAAKYTEPGGKIWINASSSPVEGRATKREAEEKDGEPPREIIITVRDTGVGISPEKLPQMFDMFTQAERSLDRAEGGLGLGLAIVKMLTDLHGGRVNAWSAGLGKGSAFSIHMPAAAAPAAGQLREIGEPGRAAAASSHPTALKEQRVLVVDDNADAAEALGRLLRRVGCELEIAFDGPTALDRAHEFHPTAVLLDIGLPGMDGYEVARRLRAEEHEEHALLVAITGYGQEEDLRRSREAGFDRHLVKPVDIGEIQQLLEKLS